MNGFTDADWDQLQADLDAYGLEDTCPSSRSTSTLTTLDYSNSLPPYRGQGVKTVFCFLTAIPCFSRFPSKHRM